MPQAAGDKTKTQRRSIGRAYMRLAAERIDLVHDHIAVSDGVGDAVDVGSQRGKLIVLTLEIDSVLEQEALNVSIWGSADGFTWSRQPLASFTPKYYCGTYSILLNLSQHPEVRYLRAQWSVQRWKKTSSKPMFVFHLYAEPSGSRVSVKKAAAGEDHGGKALVRIAI
jgi:hypothetical protein